MSTARSVARRISEHPGHLRTQGGTTLELAKALWLAAVDLFAGRDITADSTTTTDLAARHGLSACDAQ